MSSKPVSTWALLSLLCVALCGVVILNAWFLGDFPCAGTTIASAGGEGIDANLIVQEERERRNKEIREAVLITIDVLHKHCKDFEERGYIVTGDKNKVTIRRPDSPPGYSIIELSWTDPDQKARIENVSKGANNG